MRPLVLVGAGFVFGVLAANLRLKRRKNPAKSEPHESVEKFGGALWGCAQGTTTMLMVVIGNKLGLYQTIASLQDDLEAKQGKPTSFTSQQLADAGNLHERYVREWCDQHVAAKLLQRIVTATGQKQYHLSAAGAACLSDPSASTYSIGLFDIFPELFRRAAEDLPLAFKTGKGFPYDHGDGECIAKAMETSHIPFFKNKLTQYVLPAVLPAEVLQKLHKSGSTVGDLGGGSGFASIAMASAYPHSHVHLIEISQNALHQARLNVEAASLTNVTIHDVSKQSDALQALDVQFDLLFCHDVLHDMAFPQKLMKQAFAYLAPGGKWVVMDIHHTNSSAVLALGISTCLCLPSGLSEEGGQGLGTLGYTPSIAEQWSREAGFSKFEDKSDAVAAFTPANSCFVFTK